MAKSIALQRYSRNEAEEATEHFIASGCQMRHRLLHLYEREAHVALGYGTFEEYVNDRFGMEWKDSYLRQLRWWAAIERDVLPLDAQGFSVGHLPKKEVAQLSRLRSSSARKEAYDECTFLHTSDSGKVYRSPRFITDLTHIVNRMLKGIEPPKPDTPAAEPEPDTPAIPASATAEAPSQPEIPVSQTDWEEAEDHGEPDVDPTHFPMDDLESLDEPEPLDWEEGLKTALTWAENQNIDGDKQVRSSVITVLCTVAEWIAEAK